MSEAAIPQRAVFSAVFGRYEDILEQPVAATSEVPFFLFTDDPTLTSDTWTIVPVALALPGDISRSSRKVKMLGDPRFADVSERLWIDNSVLLRADPTDILDTLLADCDLAFPNHSYRTSVLSEMEEVLDLGMDDPARVYEQLHVYLRVAPEVLTVQPSWNGLFARRDTPLTRAAMMTWWEQVLRYSRRDQLSLPFAVRGLAVNRFDLDNFSSDIHEWPKAPRPVGRTPSTSLRAALQPPIVELSRAHVAMDRLSKQLTVARAELAQMGAEVARMNDEVTRVTAERDALQAHQAGVDDTSRSRLDELAGRDTELQAEVNSLRDTLDRVHQSTSWRLTAPLREVSRRVGSARRVSPRRDQST